jgi:hypothetical protein
MNEYYKIRLELAEAYINDPTIGNYKAWQEWKKLEPIK